MKYMKSFQKNYIKLQKKYDKKICYIINKLKIKDEDFQNNY